MYFKAFPFSGFNVKLLKINSKSSFDDVLKELDKTNSVAIDSSFVSSLEELNLALYLAKKSISKKKNISNQLRFEFLLYLSGKTDLKSAFSITKPKSNMMLIVCFGKALPKINGIEDVLVLAERASPTTIERISLSRI